MSRWVSGGAHFSRDRMYRWILWRYFVEQPQRILNALMLNPSDADEKKNDPTVERMTQRAIQMGFDGLLVTNIHALVSTDPDELLRHPSPTGLMNDASILQAAQQASMILCGWSSHRAARERGAAVRKMLDCARVPLHVLKLSRSGAPWHPLYLPYSLKPVPWKEVERGSKV